MEDSVVDSVVDSEGSEEVPSAAEEPAAAGSLISDQLQSMRNQMIQKAGNKIPAFSA